MTCIDIRSRNNLPATKYHTIILNNANLLTHLKIFFEQKEKTPGKKSAKRTVYDNFTPKMRWRVSKLKRWWIVNNVKINPHEKLLEKKEMRVWWLFSARKTRAERCYRWNHPHVSCCHILYIRSQRHIR